MATLWEEVPGKLTVATVQEMLGDRLANRVVAALPANYQAGIDLAKVTKGVVTAITASVGGGPLAVVGAVYAGLQQVDAALSAYAAVIQEQIDKAWLSALDRLSQDLCKQANGKILTTYQPADTLTWKRAQAFTSSKKGKIGKVETLVKQFRPGYAMGVKRPARSDYCVSTVPILVYRGGVFGSNVRASIYSDNPSGYLGTVGDDWGKANIWAPMGLVPWDGGPLRDWVELSTELKNAKGSPPIRQKIQVAPGLAPHWGPYGEEQPLSSRMAAYAAAMYSNPPPDLDFVAQKIASYYSQYGQVDPRETGVLELLWAREDLARRGDPRAGAPRGDAWPGPFMSYVYGPNYDDVDTSDGEDSPPGLGGPMAPGKKATGGNGGGGGALLVAGGLAALLIKKRRR